MTYNQLALVVPSLLALLPLLIVGRTVYFAIASARRFCQTDGWVIENRQPRNDEGEPIQLVLRYEYTVDQKTFVGRRYYFGSLNECDAGLVDRYPVGSSVLVHYDPAKPQRSTLATGYHRKLNFWLAVALVAAGCIWVVTWLAFHLPQLS